MSFVLGFEGNFLYKEGPGDIQDFRMAEDQDIDLLCVSLLC